MTEVQISCNDYVLFFAFLYSTIDISLDWKRFAGCTKPIQLWVLVSYCSIILFRLFHYIGWKLSEDGDEFLIYRQRGPPRWIIFIIFCVLYPFFLVWTILGTSWYVDIMTHSRKCLPPGSNPWFLAFWLVLCFTWVIIYSFFIGYNVLQEYRAYSAARELRLVQNSDSESLRRWGRLGFFNTWPGQWKSNGLSADQIRKLPLTEIHGDSPGQCSICLDDLKHGEKCRQLGCFHFFHQSCIDLWLLRQAECPNCKTAILAPGHDHC